MCSGTWSELLAGRLDWKGPIWKFSAVAVRQLPSIVQLHSLSSIPSIFDGLSATTHSTLFPVRRVRLGLTLKDPILLALLLLDSSQDRLGYSDMAPIIHHRLQREG